MNSSTTSASLSLKPFAVARLGRLTPRGRRLLAKLNLAGGRSNPLSINNREGATHFFFSRRAADVAALLKGDAVGVVWEVTHGQYDRGIPSTEKQWAARIIL